MDFKSHSDGNITVLAIAGRVDSYTVPQLREQLRLAASKKQPNLIVDLADVSFLDSSGLAALVYGMKHCRENGGDMCLCSPQQSVRMILELTRLDQAIDIFPSETEAVASFTN